MFCKNIILFLSKERARVYSAKICTLRMLAWKSVLFSTSHSEVHEKNSLVANECSNLTTGFLPRQTIVKLSM